MTQRRSRAAIVTRALRALAFWLLPSLVLATVGAYFAAVAIRHVNPPIVAVEGNSMRPTLHTGEAVVLERVAPARLRVGDVIAVTVAPAERATYALPAHVVHRIIKISHDPSGLVFETKGDANAGPDVFVTRPGNILGKVQYTVPAIGYVMLFVASREGLIFLLATAGVLALYFAFGLWDDRRAHLDDNARVAEALLESTAELRQLLRGDAPSADKTTQGAGAGEDALLTPEDAATSAAGAPLPEDSDAAEEPQPALGPGSAGTPAGRERLEEENLQQLSSAIEENLQRTLDMSHNVEALTEAVGEYAVHLRSHTAAVQDLASAASHLDEVVSTLAPRLGEDSLGTSAPTQLAPAGWYVDYADQWRWRWWDGTRWSAHVAPMPAAPLQASGADATERADPLVPPNGWDLERWSAYAAWAATDPLTDGASHTGHGDGHDDRG